MTIGVAGHRFEGRAELALLLLVTITACARVIPTPPPPLTVQGVTSCVGHDGQVRWTRLTDADDRADLDLWCESVGPPVVASVASRTSVVRHLTVISWNVAVGAADIDDLLDELQVQVGRDDTHGVVLLLQEAFRAGPLIPPRYPARLRVPSAIRPGRPTADVVALAERLQMSVAYVPSMRNGHGSTAADAEDRGNAILSTEPLSDVEAIELPLGRQRRVAVAASIWPRGQVGPPLRVVSLHFDTNRARVAQARALGRHLERESSRYPTIAGGDLNALRGRNDEAYRSLARVLAPEPCGTGRTDAWPARLDIPLGWWRGRLDFVFSSPPVADLVTSCETVEDFHGSDHRAVVLRLELPAGKRAPHAP